MSFPFTFGEICDRSLRGGEQPHMRSSFGTFKDLRLEHLQAMAQRLGFSDLKEGELKRLYDSLFFFRLGLWLVKPGPPSPPTYPTGPPQK